MAKSVEMKRHPSRRSSLAVSMSARNPPADLIELPDEMWQRIAKKAYELYEQRGMREEARTRGLVRSGVRRHGRDL